MTGSLLPHRVEACGQGLGTKRRCPSGMKFVTGRGCEDVEGERGLSELV